MLPIAFEFHAYKQGNRTKIFPCINDSNLPEYESDRRKYNFDADFANNADKKYVSGV